MSILRTQVCIVGGGPAGCTLALFLAKSGIPHILIEKASFPRDKVCGDGLTLEVMHTLSQIDPALLSSFLRHPKFQPCWKVQAKAPNGRAVNLNFDSHIHPYAPLYTGMRKDFDHFLWKNLDHSYTQLINPAKITQINRCKGICSIRVRSSLNGIQEIHSPLVVGADGSSSIVKRFLGERVPHDLGKKVGVGIRAYGRVKPIRERKMEFLFYKNLLPGYFWIFPLPDGQVNVGIYLPAQKTKQDKLHLPSLLDTCIRQYNATAPETDRVWDLQLPRTWSLPLCRGSYTLGGRDYLLLGDAGSLIEPFTGKGIGMAMLSAKAAAHSIIQGIDHQNKVSLQYQNAIKRMYSREYTTSNLLYKLFSHSPGANMAAWMFSRKPLSRYMHDKLQREIVKWQC